MDLSGRAVNRRYWHELTKAERVHLEEPREEEHHTHGGYVHVLLAHPAVRYDRRGEEQHWDKCALQSHLQKTSRMSTDRPPRAKLYRVRTSGWVFPPCSALSFLKMWSEYRPPRTLPSRHPVDGLGDDRDDGCGSATHLRHRQGVRSRCREHRNGTRWPRSATQCR